MTQGDAELAEHLELGGLLDPLGDDLAIDAGREMPQAGDHRLAGGIAIDVMDEADVELQELRPELHDVAQAREPRSGVIDREAAPSARVPAIA